MSRIYAIVSQQAVARVTGHLRLERLNCASNYDECTNVLVLRVLVLSSFITYDAYTYTHVRHSSHSVDHETQS